MIHIGQAITSVLRTQNISAAQLGRALGLHINTVYMILKKEHFNTDQLYNISKYLNHDFFHYYSEALQGSNNTGSLVMEAPAAYIAPKVKELEDAVLHLRLQLERCEHERKVMLDTNAALLEAMKKPKKQ